MKVSLDDGKYEVIFNATSDGVEFYANRYGEYWRDLVGDNLIYWMMCEIEHLKEENSCLKSNN